MAHSFAPDRLPPPCPCPCIRPLPPCHPPLEASYGQNGQLSPSDLTGLTARGCILVPASSHMGGMGAIVKERFYCTTEAASGCTSVAAPVMQGDAKQQSRPHGHDWLKMEVVAKHVKTCARIKAYHTCNVPAATSCHLPGVCWKTTCCKPGTPAAQYVACLVYNAHNPAAASGVLQPVQQVCHCTQLLRITSPTPHFQVL
jgi:hypothetical protein